jgi:chemotaxis family two-component system sensor histidine kinase/response regulator PixL
MPGMDGFQVLEWLRASPEWSKLPVVVLSGSNLDCDRQTARDLGARAYYVKPIKHEETQAMLKAICDEWLKDGADGEQK